MSKVWLDSYPEGVPAEIDGSGYPSLVALIDDSLQRFANQSAFENLGVRLSYAEIDRLSRAFAAYLQRELGLVKGDRIALMMPNLLQYPVALIGALRAGLVVVNTNPLYTARELRHQLSDSGTRVILVCENFAHTLAECIHETPVEHVIMTRMGDLLGFPKGLVVDFVVKRVKKLVPPYRLDRVIGIKQALAAGEGLSLEPVELRPDDLACLQYTGGTTGLAKGAMLSHGNLVANVTQAGAWLKPVIADGQELIVTALPLYHIFAFTANCLTFLKGGALNLLITNPRDMKGFVKLLGGVRFSVITGVNTLFNGLLNTPGFEALDFSRLKVSLGGGMAVQRAVAERWKAATGCPLLEAYGLTETSPAVCMNPLDLEDFNGTVGLPIPSTECRIQNEAGAALPEGEAGELCVRGPQVMRGYWQRAEETAKCIDAEGWLHTGDIAIMDEHGFVRIVDRIKDMILVSGFNVYPNEVEEVVAAHPDVFEVGAIGVPDQAKGEMVKLVVVKRNPGLTAQALRDYCHANLTGYKRPQYIEFATELPKSNVGKILRRELRERFGQPRGE